MWLLNNNLTEQLHSVLMDTALSEHYVCNKLVALLGN